MMEGVLHDVIACLRCPLCRNALDEAGGAVRCREGHSFDVARQGYVSLLTGSETAGTADTPAMVAARASFLGEGHYAPLAARLAEFVTQALNRSGTGETTRSNESTTPPGPSAISCATNAAVTDPDATDVTHATHATGPSDAAGGRRTGRVIADAGAGTGYYLAAALAADALAGGGAAGLAAESRAGGGAAGLAAESRARGGAAGIALDVSKHALKRAARAHERIGAVVADLWRPLPLKDDSVEVLLNVFAPRNGPEFARVLRPGGTLIVVTPGPGHLGELVDRLGLLSVSEDKDRRTAATLEGHFRQVAHTTLETTMWLSHAAVEAVVGMGPSAWHIDVGSLRRTIAELPETTGVHASFRITLWMPDS
jgi:23S rRNA (guanine745-N1)-methyltransferase